MQDKTDKTESREKQARVYGGMLDTLRTLPLGESPLGLCLLAIGVLWVVNWQLRCPEVYGRHAFKRGRREPGSSRRRQLDELRAAKGHFPKPFPEGWYKICDSKQIPKGGVVNEIALNREFVVFRGEDGKAGVVDAFCPHLGTHLGHGGKVQGNNIVCPYHLWEFDCDGTNKNIPYCKKDMTGVARVNLKSYHTYESAELGAIFFWYSADGVREPRWPLHCGLTELENCIRSEGMRRVCDDRWEDMLMHIFEPSQNSADYFHFSTIHQYLPMPFNLKLVAADHTIETKYGAADSDLPEHMLLIRERLTRLRVFGWDIFTLPKFIADSIVTFVVIQGPQNIMFKVDTAFGRFRGHFALLPVEPFRQKATMVMYADKNVPWFMGRLLHWWIKETARQDAEVWENKIHIRPRNLVPGDGPFAGYGKWLEKFYTDKSVTWEQIRSGASLDW